MTVGMVVSDSQIKTFVFFFFLWGGGGGGAFRIRRGVLIDE